MTVEEVVALAREKYGVEPDYPWSDENIVLRHADNRKWFGLLMKIPAEKLGLKDQGSIEIMNVKCDPIMAASLYETPGFFPAYHMSKTHWITLALDRVSREEIEQMLDFSFALTEKNRKIR